jgi:hypothetical protein
VRLTLTPLYGCSGVPCTDHCLGHGLQQVGTDNYLEVSAVVTCVMVLSAVGIASAFVIRLLGRSLLESHRVLRTFRKSYRRNLGTMCGWFLVRRVQHVAQKEMVG